MDPNATLEQIRKLSAIADGFPEESETLHQLADLIRSLDQWLSTGGFLPRDWQQGRQTW